MQLALIDWVIIAAFFVFSLVGGIWASRRAGTSTAEFFLSGRKMPWWLLGISMVATTFSASAPNWVADAVRSGGVAKNWLWWSMVLTGTMTVFIYSKLWRRIGVMTDIERRGYPFNRRKLSTGGSPEGAQGSAGARASAAAWAVLSAGPSRRR